MASSKQRLPAEVDVTTVLIADQQPLFCTAVATALRQEPDLMVFDHYPADPSSLDQAVEVYQPDIVLLDFWLDGYASTGRIIERVPECKVIVLSLLYDAEQVQAAIAAGAAGFLPKNVGLETLLGAVRKAKAGEQLVYAKELQRLVHKMAKRQKESEEFEKRLATLSKRELQVFTLLSRGKLIEDVARDLKVSPATVTSHIRSLLKKTGAKSQVDVLAMARRAGVIQG